MKKFVSGIIVGALIFAGASAFAAPSSLIGQKVQGLFSIEQGGKKLSDAVVINGSAYAPVRAVADAAGASLTVEGKKIIMGESLIKENASPNTSIDSLKNQRDLLVYEISKRESNIRGIEEEGVPTHEQLAKELANNGTLGKQHQEAIDSYKKEVEKMKGEIIELNKQLTDINAQIAAFQK